MPEQSIRLSALDNFLKICIRAPTELQESISGAIALLWGPLHPPHHIKHLPRRVRASECDRDNGCRQQFRWGHEGWGLTGWERRSRLYRQDVRTTSVGDKIKASITHQMAIAHHAKQYQRI
ncbi:hypothetical protein B9S53_10500 [Arthrospira sp. O9.13F]|nr:hypothetical protein B9S53_10500 [Arthrospira sp. O9.13F]